MNQNERMIKLCTASAEVLERVDRVLDGREAAHGADDINLKTITLKEAAERLGVSRPTVYRLVRKGEIKTALIAGLERVRLASLVEYATRPVDRRLAAVGC